VRVFRMVFIVVKDSDGFFPSRAIRRFQTKEATVAKLFAKHIKIEEAVKFLQKTRIGIAVGTPVRLSDLMDRGK
jgi:protein CMS1